MAKKKKSVSKALKKEVHLPIKLPKNKVGEHLGKKRRLPLPWPLRPIGRYIKNSARELKKVNWPSRKESLKLTFAVVAFTLVLMVIIVIADLVLSRLVERILL